MGVDDSMAILAWQLQCVGLPRLEREVLFHPERKWRFDGAYREHWLAVECEGGTWAKSRHTTGTGFQEDIFKYGEATALGWTVLRGTTKQFQDGTMARWIERRLKGHP